MPTLQELTLAHSRRLSEIYRTREVRLAEAQALRDAALRDLPAAAKAYQSYDNEASAAREKQVATEAKAEAARSSALLGAVDRRSDRFDAAQLARQRADSAALAAKRHAEDEAEREYVVAMAALREADAGRRHTLAQDAERARRLALDEARRVHGEALTAAQQQYRAAIDEALLAERRDSRDGERAYRDAVRLSEAAARGSRTFAEQNLAQALAKIPEAREVLRAWRQHVAAIAAETKEAEQEAFARFRLDLDALKS